MAQFFIGLLQPMKAVTIIGFISLLLPRKFQFDKYLTKRYGLPDSQLLAYQNSVQLTITFFFQNKTTNSNKIPTFASSAFMSCPQSKNPSYWLQGTTGSGRSRRQSFNREATVCTSVSLEGNNQCFLEAKFQNSYLPTGDLLKKISGFKGEFCRGVEPDKGVSDQNFFANTPFWNNNFLSLSLPPNCLKEKLMICFLIKTPTVQSSLFSSFFTSLSTSQFSILSLVSHFHVMTPLPPWSIDLFDPSEP